jgi:hypothetical protein
MSDNGGQDPFNLVFPLKSQAIASANNAAPKDQPALVLCPVADHLL